MGRLYEWFFFLEQQKHRERHEVEQTDSQPANDEEDNGGDDNGDGEIDPYEDAEETEGGQEFVIGTV